MAKQRHSSRRHSSRRQRRSVKRGGSANYSSASSYGTYVNGSGDSQYARVFDQSGSNAANQSNIIVGAQGQWATQPGVPTNLNLIQSAGKKKRGSRKNKRGGLMGEVMSQALVPFSILALQQSYRKKRGGKRTRRANKH